MNRAVTVTFCALEALLVVGIGVGIALVPLSLLWAFEYGLQVDWVVFWRVAADAWLIGHGVDLHIVPPSDAAEVLGFTGASSFDITIAALGFALVTLLLAVRAGRRIGATPHWRIGLVTAAATFAALALAVVATATHPTASPSLVQGVAFPTVVFVAGLALGLRRSLADAGSDLDERRTVASDLLQRIPPDARVIILASLRGGAAAVAGVIVVSAAACAALIGARYAEIVALYEGVHAGALGGIALTLGQLALAPNLVVWAAAWFVGPGFAIGAGSSVGPLGTHLGTIPVIPVFGAVPVEAPAWAFVGLLVPILAAFVAGVVMRRRLTGVFERESPLLHIAVGAGIGVVGGAILALLAAASAGAAGPGRLAIVGPDPLLVGLWAALEFGAAATIGVLAGGRARGD